jgi:hypothetical protein
MPNSLVTKAEIDGNNHIVLSVKVDAFYTREYVEISGYATQNSLATTSGAGFATFSEIQEIDPPKDGGPVVLKVKAKPTNAFQKDLDVTVAVRVSKVWVTVLSAVPGYAANPAPTVPAPANTTWASVTGVGGPDDYSSTQGSDGTTTAGGPASPPAPGAPASPTTAGPPATPPTA